MFQTRHTLLLLSLLLIACEPVQQPEVQPEHTGPQGEVLEEPAEITETASGSLQIVERLLPSGIIEIGDREAPLVLLMFTEHHCRYCKDFQRELFAQLHRDFIAQGNVRLQIAILPLKKYADSEDAALGLLCAAMQGKGIPMHELLFTLGASSRDTLLSEALTLELDTTLFTQCLDSPDTARTLERQRSLARSLDVTLVPTFFLNGEKSVGLPYYADLKGMINEKLGPSS